MKIKNIFSSFCTKIHLVMIYQRVFFQFWFNIHLPPPYFHTIHPYLFTFKFSSEELFQFETRIDEFIKMDRENSNYTNTMQLIKNFLMSNIVEEKICYLEQWLLFYLSLFWEQFFGNQETWISSNQYLLLFFYKTR